MRSSTLLSAALASPALAQSITTPNAPPLSPPTPFPTPLDPLPSLSSLASQPTVLTPNTDFTLTPSVTPSITANLSLPPAPTTLATVSMPGNGTGCDAGPSDTVIVDRTTAVVSPVVSLRPLPSGNATTAMTFSSGSPPVATTTLTESTSPSGSTTPVTTGAAASVGVQGVWLGLGGVLAIAQLL